MMSLQESLVGHRCAGYFYPENTFGSLDVAHAHNLKNIEFDVRLTKDNILVVSHDESLMRCGHSRKNISGYSFSELSDIDVGVYHPFYSQKEYLPRFNAFLDKALSFGFNCQIELKPEKHQETLLAEAFANALQAKVTASCNNIIVTSFSQQCLSHLNLISKGAFETGVLIKKEETLNWAQYANECSPSYIHIHGEYITPALAESIQEKGYKLNAYHLNHPKLIEAALKLGCNRFTCDSIDLIK